MKFRIKDYPEIREKVAAMDITDLIRSVICPNIYVGSPLPLNTNAVFIHKATIEQGQEITAQINSGREIPALIAAVSSIVCLALFGPANFILPALSVTVVLLFVFRRRITAGEEGAHG